MHIFKESSKRTTTAYYVSKTRLKSKHFQVEFMLHVKPSTEDCCSAVGERESYYLAGTNGLIKTTFTQKRLDVGR